MGKTWVLVFTIGVGLASARQDGELEKKIERLVQALGDDSKEARDKAVTELAKVGKPALGALRKATANSDAEVRALAAQAIDRIEWGAGLEKVRQYVKERFEDGATVEPSKLKSIQRWFPDTRFYEVGAGGGGAPGGVVMMGGRGGGGSVFAVGRYEEGFSRILVKGVFCNRAFVKLLEKQKIKLEDYDTALDFALAFMELYWMSSGQMYMAGGNSRFDKAAEGWEFQVQNYALNFTFKTDKDGILTEVVQPSNRYWQQSSSNKLGEEKIKLEVEKLKMELELLKRQLEEPKRK